MRNVGMMLVLGAMVGGCAFCNNMEVGIYSVHVTVVDTNGAEVDGAVVAGCRAEQEVGHFECSNDGQVVGSIEVEYGGTTWPVPRIVYEDVGDRCSESARAEVTVVVESTT